MMFRSISSFCVLGLSLLLLGGCSVTGAAVGAGAAVGVAAAQEGGLSRAAQDAGIQIQINDLWFRYDVDMFRKLDITVNQGRVLLTGVVQNPEHRVEAVRLAWQPEGVKQVINEIRVAESQGIVGFARDTWISGRLRTALTFDREVLSINYSIDTVQGTVYLMGVAQNQVELNRVIETARVIPDVKAVVSYVRLAGRNKDSPSSSAQQDYYEEGGVSYLNQQDSYPLAEEGYRGETGINQSYDNSNYSSGAVEAQPVNQSRPGTLQPADSRSPSTEQLLNAR